MPPATASPTTSTEHVDVLVVGARCAGAAAAISLARFGRRVVAIDRASFPSDTLSTHVNFPSSVAETAKLGALERVLRSDPPRCRYGMIEADGARCLQRFAEVDGIDYGICVPRPEFDMALVETARAAGAEVRERTSLDRLVWEGGRVAGAVVRDQDGEEREIRAHLVIGADGRRSTVARLVGAERPYRGSRNGRGCAFFYMDDPKVGTEWRDRLIQLRMAGTHALIFPCPDDRVLCLFMGPREEIPDARREPEAFWERMLEENPAVAERLGGATNMTKLRSTGDNPAYFRRSTGPGWALVGDAGHFKDPIIGQGMRDAMRFGRLAGAAAAPVLEDHRALDAALLAVEERRDRECMATYHWGNRESRIFPVTPLVKEALTTWDGAEPPHLLHMFDRIRSPHRVLNPLVGARFAAKAMLRPGVDRKAIVDEVLEEARLDLGIWKDDLLFRFRAPRRTRNERQDWVWPPERPAPARPASPPAAVAASESPASPSAPDPIAA